jgi:glyoxylase-like metal-dependent hydrolase (beta-lactamase superfamily II)
VAAPPRYYARFFRIDLAERPSLSGNPGLSDSVEWAPPAEWLRRYRAGSILLPASVSGALEGLVSGVVPIPGLHPIPLSDSIPESESVVGVRQLWVRSNTLPPALHTNCFLIGDADAERVLIDPSPNSTAELERLCMQVQRPGFHAVLLTHHHPDHRQFADEIARRYRVPIWMSADTQRRIRAAQPRFLEGVQQRLLAEGDVVSRWLGQPVRVLEVPGHDEGQLALMPDDRAWCIVGDLIQGIGTVVIAQPEGDMRKYFASLRRLIELKPRAIFPSHGLALGGVYYLEKTLQHREQREQQVRALFEAGRSVTEMLRIIYADLDPRLQRLAQANIESHLAKLKAEGVVAPQKSVSAR